MARLNIDIDRLSDQELADLATDLWRKLVARGRPVPALVIPGADQKPVGYLVPAMGIGKSPAADAEFLAESFRRIDNPPDRYLTVDEFLCALDEYWATADATAHMRRTAGQPM
jgi:hypothetical protein